jgi:hypothetical protein
MFGKLISTPVQAGTGLVLTETIITAELETMFAERNRLTEAAATTRQGHHLLLFLKPEPQQQNAPNGSTSKLYTKTTSAALPTLDKQEKAKEKNENIEDKLDTSPEGPADPKRDSSVSDAVWNQLMLDKQAEVARDNEYRRLQEEKFKKSNALLS